MDFSCVEKVRKLRIPYGTRETRTYHVSNHMGLDHLAASCVRLMISTAISFCMNVLSSESLGAMEEDDDVSTWWNDWGYGYDKEPEQERVEQPYLDSIYQARLGFPSPECLFQPFDVQVPSFAFFYDR